MPLETSLVLLKKFYCDWLRKAAIHFESASSLLQRANVKRELGPERRLFMLFAQIDAGQRNFEFCQMSCNDKDSLWCLPFSNAKDATYWLEFSNQSILLTV